MAERLFVITMGDGEVRSFLDKMMSSELATLYVREYSRNSEDEWYISAWKQPVKLQCELNMLDREGYDERNWLLSAYVVVVEAEAPEITEGVTGYDADWQSMNLEHARLRVLFDYARNVGVIDSARLRSESGGANRAYQCPKLGAMDDNYQPKGEDELLYMGIPKNLLESPALLEQLS